MTYSEQLRENTNYLDDRRQSCWCRVLLYVEVCVTGEMSTNAERLKIRCTPTIKSELVAGDECWQLEQEDSSEPEPKRIPSHCIVRQVLAMRQTLACLVLLWPMWPLRETHSVTNIGLALTDTGGTVGVNQHSLLKINVLVQVKGWDSCDVPIDSLVRQLPEDTHWIVSIDEVSLATTARPPPSSFSSSPSDPQTSSSRDRTGSSDRLLQMEEFLTLNWSVESSTIQGSTAVSFLLPLLEDNENDPHASRTRTLLVAVWEQDQSSFPTGKKRKRLLTRRLVQVPRTLGLYQRQLTHMSSHMYDGASTVSQPIKPYTILDLEATSRCCQSSSVLPILTPMENKNIGLYVPERVVWISVAMTVLVTFYFSFGRFFRGKPHGGDELHDHPLQGNSRRDQAAKIPSNADDEWSVDDEVSSSHKSSIADQSQDSGEETEPPNTTDNPQNHLATRYRHMDYEWLNAEHDEYENTTGTHIVENPHFVLAWSQRRYPHNSGFSTDDEVELPPPMARHVVRPIPSQGITFEAEIERFNSLDLSSPVGSRSAARSATSSGGRQRSQRTRLHLPMPHDSPQPLVWDRPMLFNSPTPVKRRSSALQTSRAENLVPIVSASEKRTERQPGVVSKEKNQLHHYFYTLDWNSERKIEPKNDKGDNRASEPDKQGDRGIENPGSSHDDVPRDSQSSHIESTSATQETCARHEETALESSHTTTEILGNQSPIDDGCSSGREPSPEKQTDSEPDTVPAEAGTVVLRVSEDEPLKSPSPMIAPHNDCYTAGNRIGGTSSLKQRNSSSPVNDSPDATDAAITTGRTAGHEHSSPDAEIILSTGDTPQGCTREEALDVSSSTSDGHQLTVDSVKKQVLNERETQLTPEVCSAEQESFAIKVEIQSDAETERLRDVARDTEKVETLTGVDRPSDQVNLAAENVPFVSIRSTEREDSAHVKQTAGAESTGLPEEVQDEKTTDCNQSSETVVAACSLDGDIRVQNARSGGKNPTSGGESSFVDTEKSVVENKVQPQQMEEEPNRRSHGEREESEPQNPGGDTHRKDTLRETIAPKSTHRKDALRETIAPKSFNEENHDEDPPTGHAIEIKSSGTGELEQTKAKGSASGGRGSSSPAYTSESSPTDTGATCITREQQQQSSSGQTEESEKAALNETFAAQTLYSNIGGGEDNTDGRQKDPQPVTTILQPLILEHGIMSRTRSARRGQKRQRVSLDEDGLLSSKEAPGQICSASVNRQATTQSPRKKTRVFKPSFVEVGDACQTRDKKDAASESDMANTNSSEKTLSFTYVSTLSPDSITTDDGNSQSRFLSPRIGCPGHSVGASLETRVGTSETQKTDEAEDDVILLRRKRLREDGDNVERTKNPMEALTDVVPEIVPSTSLAAVTQNLEAPVWHFTEEQANAKKKAKRRNPTRSAKRSSGVSNPNSAEKR